MTAAVVFPACDQDPETSALEEILTQVDDSKKLSSQARAQCCHIIRKTALAISIAAIPSDDIDRMGIGKATARCMALSAMKLKTKPDYLLVDGLKKPASDDFEYAHKLRSDRLLSANSDRGALEAELYSQIPSQAIIRGDSKSLSISAASIVAKVTRDRMMIFYERKYPGYGFGHHKGYGTEEHIRKLAELGPTPIHRYTFSPLIHRALNFADE